MCSSRHRLILCLTVLAVSAPEPAAAQIGRLRDRIKARVEEKIAEKTGQPTDDGARPVEAGANAAPARPGEGVWVNYDFQPGERVLFAEDLSVVEVGGFPPRLDLEQGNMEVVEWQGRRFLRATSEFEVKISLREPLPERFTIEFDLHTTYHASSRSTVEVDFGQGEEADHFACSPHYAGFMGRGGDEAKAMTDLATRNLTGRVVRCRVMADGRYAKAYVDEVRVANHPNTTLGRSRAIKISGFVTEEYPIMIGDIRVAAGGKKLYDALSATGRVATQGILFDTGSDGIRPESTPTLKEITAMLGEHPELKLTIEGHTDGAGQAAANLTLSEQRAAAVKAYLVSRGIDASRLQSRGFGASKPAGSNDTPEGRQQNRRVELVRM